MRAVLGGVAWRTVRGSGLEDCVGGVALRAVLRGVALRSVLGEWPRGL